MPNSRPIPAPIQMFDYGFGIFGHAIVCYRMGDEFFLCGITASGDPRVLPSLGMAREVAASALP